ncbi:hypothetical protein GGR57DRAFT_477262 [Xylariaceae sp. FL1272]|nr:hypothetical protein GGR57DRAFT_477262 [Xylariaceae sp. FL1272]
MSAPTPTIGDFGLVRTYLPPRMQDVAFLKDHLGEGMSDIELRDHFDESGVISDLGTPGRPYAWYAYSEHLNAYVTFYANTTVSWKLDSRRHTAMRYRDMIIDNIRSAGGDLKGLRWSIVKDVGNRAARAAIHEHFERAGKDWVTKCNVESYPSDGDWEELAARNPFTRCTEGLLREYAEQMGYTRITRVIFVSEGRRPPDSRQYGNPTVHMLIELHRPSEDFVEG